MKQGNVYTLTVALLGAGKLVAEAFGYSVISDDQVNAISNGVAAIAAVVGVVLNHINKKDE